MLMCVYLLFIKTGWHRFLVGFGGGFESDALLLALTKDCVHWHQTHTMPFESLVKAIILAFKNMV